MDITNVSNLINEIYGHNSDEQVVHPQTTDTNVYHERPELRQGDILDG
jgi:hypothetical protein